MKSMARVTFLAIVLLGLSLAACLPKPEKKIEWLRLKDAVIVQMKEAGGLPEPELFIRATSPDFTLYGDGRLIVKDDSTIPPRLVERALSDDEIQDLLEFIDDRDYFDFNYEQPRLGVFDFATTFLYVNTMQAANAVSAYALTVEPPDGGEWEQFRRLQAIRKRLVTIAGEALTSGEATDFEPEAFVLIVQAFPPAISGPVPAEWPFTAIDLASILSGEEIGERRLAGETAQDVVATLSNTDSVLFLQDGQRFQVAYRPLLPYEEHFPEFETPQ